MSVNMKWWRNKRKHITVKKLVVADAECLNTYCVVDEEQRG